MTILAPTAARPRFAAPAWLRTGLAHRITPRQVPVSALAVGPDIPLVPHRDAPIRDSGLPFFLQPVFLQPDREHR